MAKPKMRRIRGEYRPFFEALFTGKDFQALSPDAKLAFMFVKGLSGAAGIRVWPAFVEQLAEMTGMATVRTKRAVTELAEAGWLELEASVVWVVRGLSFEPQMVPTNEKHRTWLNEHLDSLPRVALLARFRDRNSEWFAPLASDDATDKAAEAGTESDRVSDSQSDTLSDTNPNPNPNSLSPAQSLALSPATSTSPVIASDAQHRTRLAVAANKGLTVQFGEQPVPLRWDHPGTFECAEALATAGVDLGFAELALFRIASTKKPADGRPPKSLKYFINSAIDAWRAEEMQRVIAVAATPGANDGVVANRDPNYFAAVRYAREGDAQWQSYCRERGIDWEAAA